MGVKEAYEQIKALELKDFLNADGDMPHPDWHAVERCIVYQRVMRILEKECPELKEEK